MRCTGAAPDTYFPVPQSRFIDAFGNSELGMALFCKVFTNAEIAARRSIERPVETAIAKVLDYATGEEVHPGEIVFLAVRPAPGMNHPHNMKIKITWSKSHPISSP